MNDAEKLASLLEEGVIDEVLGQLQSGKEASIYVVRRGDEVVAAKVYKERDQRSFKNNAVYTEGRKVRKPKPPMETKPSDLLDALRRSAKGGAKPAKIAGKASARKPAKRAAAPLRKTG